MYYVFLVNFIKEKKMLPTVCCTLLLPSLDKFGIQHNGFCILLVIGQFMDYADQFLLYNFPLFDRRSYSWLIVFRFRLSFAI